MSGYDQNSAYDNYDSDTDLSPYEMLMRMQAWNKAIYLRIENAEKDIRTELSVLDGEIRQEVTDVHNELSTIISTTAEGIEASILDLDKKLSTRITTTASGIRADIVDLDEEMQAQFAITAKGIASKVSTTDFNGKKMASLISQDASAITLIANELNLGGFVTFNSLKAGGTTEIDGGRITTGYISAARLDSDVILAKVIAAGGISADYIQAGRMSGIEIVSSSFFSGSALAGVIIDDGKIIAEDNFIGRRATVDGSFECEDDEGNAALLYPSMLQIEDSSRRLRIFPDELQVERTFSFIGSYDFSDAEVYGLQVDSSEARYLIDDSGDRQGADDFAKGHTRGIGIAWSSSSNRLYVRINGSNIGYVVLAND